MGIVLVAEKNVTFKLNDIIKVADEMFDATLKGDSKHRCNVQSVRIQYRNK